jgi:hypothetical protein
MVDDPDDIQKAIRDQLLSDVAVDAMFDDRMFDGVAPKGTAFPYIVYSAISDVPATHFGGQSAMSRAAFQIDVYAATSPSRFAGSKLIRNRLKNGPASWGETSMYACTLESSNDTKEFPEPGEHLVMAYRRRMDFLVIYKLSVPT